VRVALCYDPLRFFPRCYDLFFLDLTTNLIEDSDYEGVMMLPFAD